MRAEVNMMWGELQGARQGSVSFLGVDKRHRRMIAINRQGHVVKGFQTHKMFVDSESRKVLMSSDTRYDSHDVRKERCCADMWVWVARVSE